MRRLVIAILVALEAAVGCAIFVASLQLSVDLQRSAAVARVTHAVVSRARILADVVTERLRRLT
jgi:hypothetical protein